MYNLVQLNIKNHFTYLYIFFPYLPLWQFYLSSHQRLNRNLCNLNARNIFATTFQRYIHAWALGYAMFRFHYRHSHRQLVQHGDCMEDERCCFSLGELSSEMPSTLLKRKTACFFFWFLSNYVKARMIDYNKVMKQPKGIYIKFLSFSSSKGAQRDIIFFIQPFTDF